MVSLVLEQQLRLLLMSFCSCCGEPRLDNGRLTHDTECLWRSYECVKHQKRMWLREAETGELVYTPPDFMRHKLQSRESMRELASRLSEIGRYDINTIIDFESRYSRRVIPPVDTPDSD
jgi:hypothetical protein